LENVRKRLDLIYDDRYSLEIEDDGERYCVTLKIPTLNGDEMHSN
jgi:sensor histidine kinase YesM